MKTNFSTFITAIAFLLLAATTAVTQEPKEPKAYFKKDGDTLFQTPISEIDSIVFKQITELSEEEVTELFTNFEDFVNSPGFQSSNTIEEMKSALENWFRQQTEVENVKTEGNVLIITFKDGATTEIKFMESTESEPEEYEFEYGPETVDINCFTGLTLQNAIAKEQSNTEWQSVTRVATAAYEPDYIFPVIWEPDFSFESDIIKIYNSHQGPSFPKLNPRKAKSAQCNPLSLEFTLKLHNYIGNREVKPNLIIINAHGNKDLLEIGCCSPFDRYNEIKKDLKDKGITIIGTPREMRVMIDNGKGATLYFISITSADLRILLKGIDLSNSIVFLNACESMVYSSFSDVFLDLGAQGVFGYSKATCIECVRNMTNILLKYILTPISAPTSEDPSRKTTTDILTAWSKVYGNTDISQSKNLTLWHRNGNLKFKYPPLDTRRPVIPGRSATRSSNATQEQGVAMFGSYIHYYSPSAGYSKSYYGFVYSSQTNNPKVGDGKSKNVFAELDHDIFDGEYYFLSANDIEYNKQYYCRAFVFSNYSGGAYIHYSDVVEPFIVEGEKAQVSTNPCNENNITETTAVVSGNVIDAGKPAYTERGICWSTRSNPTIYDRKDGASVNNGQPTSYSYTLTGLEPNTTYYAKAYVIQNNTPVYGNEISFKTKEEQKAAQVSTNACNENDITETTAIVSGNVIDAGKPAYTEKGICWSTRSNPTINDNKQKATGNSSQLGYYSCELTGLTKNTTYYAKAYVIQNDKPVYGNVISFKTPQEPFFELSTSQINFPKEGGTNSFTIETNYKITEISSSQAWCKISYDKNNPIVVDITVEKNETTSTQNAIIWVWAINPVTNDKEGKAVSIKQEAGENNYKEAQVSTSYNENDITETTAIVSGYITDAGKPAYTERGICWSKRSNPTINDNKVGASVNNGQPTSYSCTLTGLEPNTTYYAKAFVIQNNAPVYGNEISFKTKDGRIEKEAQVYTSYYEITRTTAIIECFVTDEGIPAYTEMGICWSKRSNPTINDNKDGFRINGGNRRAYSPTLTGLEPDMTYYAKAYVMQNNTPVYGNEISFKTGDPKETQVSTSYNENNITETTAIVSGYIADAGKPAYTERGICWSTRSNPTINDRKDGASVNNGQPTSYSCTLTGLEPNTTYYAKAFVIQNNAPVYGNEISFKTKQSDGNWVEINGVKWATRNVGVVPGTFAPNPENYGGYYKWGIDPSPAGYRLPNAGEVNSLMYSTNVSSVWTMQNGVNGRRFTDNTSGKSIFLPAAGYAWANVVYHPGVVAYWWSSAQWSNECGWSFGFDNLNGGASGLDKGYQVSIRSVLY